jgi:ribosomal protein L11
MMNVTNNQKILLRKTLAKYGVNANKLCTQLNDKSEAIKKVARTEIAFLINHCTGKSVMFTLTHPYTRYYKNFRSPLNVGQTRHA